MTKQLKTLNQSYFDVAESILESPNDLLVILFYYFL